MRGYFGIGIENYSKDVNVGTLWRSATILGARFIFTIGNKRYNRQSSDTNDSAKHVPLFHFESPRSFQSSLRDCCVIGVEMCPQAIEIQKFTHPERAVYILGNERVGLSSDSIEICDVIVRLPGEISFNVSTAGSIICFDRITKFNNK